MANTKPKGGLTAWFGKGKKGDWVDIGAPKKKGRYQACGRKSAKLSRRLSQITILLQALQQHQDKYVIRQLQLL